MSNFSNPSGVPSSPSSGGSSGYQQAVFDPSEVSRGPYVSSKLYVGNLDPKVTDALLYEIFSTIGPLEGCKVIKDKNGNSSGYGFVDYHDNITADRALQHLNGRKIYNYEIKVNWAYAGGQREDTTNHFHIFVGDLSPEIDDKALFMAFLAFGSCTDARVMWDQGTGRSRGYGFVAFKKKEDAERALTGMNGEWLGNRAIRCNWANQKVTTNSSADLTNNNDLTSVMSQSPQNTTVYVGNLTPDVSDEQLIRTIFEEHGKIEEVRMQKEKGYAFVRYENHEQAARAISSIHSRNIGSKQVKCSWGKERTNATPSLTGPSFQPSVVTAVQQPFIPQPMVQVPGYSQPYASYPYTSYNQPVNYQYVQGYPYAFSFDPSQQVPSGLSSPQSSPNPNQNQ